MAMNLSADDHLDMVWFSQLGMNDVESVGGKNASLGEMISHLADAGVSVPDGFATTADAYREFLEYFDGFSIGFNDMTQLSLGLDRDSGLISHLFDERDPAIEIMLEKPSRPASATIKYVGICGQGPSDYPDLAKWLLEQGIESMSLNPDTVVSTWLYLAGATVE